MSSLTRKSAFSLIELLVACSLFMGLLSIVFVFFRFGTRAFQTATRRQGVQADSLRIMDSLQSDLKRTSAKSVRVLSRTATVGSSNPHRDQVSFCALKNWSDVTDTENFGDDVNARWNRYWIYYASRSEAGKLVRLKVDPIPPPIAPIPLSLEKLNTLQEDNPDANRFAGVAPTYSVLSKHVFEFAVNSPSYGEFQVSLKLKESMAASPSGGSQTRQETYEILMNVRPENTFPPEET